MTADPFALQRFLGAQNPVFAQVRGELAAGEKLSENSSCSTAEQILAGSTAKNSALP
jgi:uncharacterized protein (DUF1810 family)